MNYSINWNKKNFCWVYSKYLIENFISQKAYLTFIEMLIVVILWKSTISFILFVYIILKSISRDFCCNFDRSHAKIFCTYNFETLKLKICLVSSNMRHKLSMQDKIGKLINQSASGNRKWKKIGAFSSQKSHFIPYSNI